MSQDTLNSVLIITTVGMLIHAILQHRKLNTLTNVVGYMLASPEKVWASAKDVAKRMGLFDEPDA